MRCHQLPALLLIALLPTLCLAQKDELLAKMLANPVGAPNSVPLQANWNYNVGPRYFAESTPMDPNGWGFRVNLILMFPTK